MNQPTPTMKITPDTVSTTGRRNRLLRQPQRRGKQHGGDDHLTDFDAGVERQQRRDEPARRQVHLAKHVREPESVHQAEAEGEHPAVRGRRGEEVVERHVRDRQGDAAFDQA